MRYQPPILESELLDGFSVRYLKLSGLWAVINHQRTTGKKNLYIRVWVFISLIISAPYISFQLIGFFTIRIDLQKATVITVPIFVTLQVLSKLLVFLFGMESICWLYDLTKKDFLRVPERKRPQFEQIFKKITKKTETNMKIISATIYGIVATSIVNPGISVDYIAHHTGSMAAVTGGKMKILGGWYPVPMDQSPYYEIIYAFEAVATLWFGTIINLFISFFYQLLMCLYAQFTALGYLLSTLNVDAVDGTKIRREVDHRSSDKDMYKELYAILKDHQKLLSYANELRSVYNPLVTMILGMGIFVLVLSVFQFLFGGAVNPMFLLRSLQYSAYQLAEVGMFCFCSSSIEAASSDLQFAIYSSDWYKADVNFKKSAQMLMVRARRGVTLTAIKMYPVNVETIMAIIQFTYSVTTLMSRMTE